MGGQKRDPAFGAISICHFDLIRGLGKSRASDLGIIGETQPIAPVGTPQKSTFGKGLVPSITYADRIYSSGEYSQQVERVKKRLLLIFVGSTQKFNPIQGNACYPAVIVGDVSGISHVTIIQLV